MDRQRIRHAASARSEGHHEAGGVPVGRVASPSPPRNGKSPWRRPGALSVFARTRLRAVEEVTLHSIARHVFSSHRRHETPELVLRVFATENDRLLLVAELVKEGDAQRLYRIERAVQEELNPHARVTVHLRSSDRRRLTPPLHPPSLSLIFRWLRSRLDFSNIRETIPAHLAGTRRHEWAR